MYSCVEVLKNQMVKNENAKNFDTFQHCFSCTTLVMSSNVLRFSESKELVCYKLVYY